MLKIVSGKWALLAALAGAIVLFTASSQAQPKITALEKKYCKQDYKHFCGSYGLNSPALTSCMRRAGKKLSRGCVEALIKSGKVTRAEVNARR